MREFRFGDVYRDREDGETLMYCGAGEREYPYWLVIVPSHGFTAGDVEALKLNPDGDFELVSDEPD